MNSKKQETLNTLRKKWNWESAPAKADKMSFILDRSRKDYEKVVGEDGIGLARYQSECLVEFGIGTFEDVTSAVALEATVAAVEAVEEAFDGYPAGTVTWALGQTVANSILGKTDTPTSTESVDLVMSNADPANIPVSFLGRQFARTSAFVGVGVLGLGCVTGAVLSGGGSAAYAAPAVHGQTLTVASAEPISAVRDEISVASVAIPTQVSGTVVSTVPAGASNSALVNSALKYVGSNWDCTMLVEQALRDLGHSVGDLAPMGFGAYGQVFTDPNSVQAGDIMMRPGHVAIYAGNGMSVQGGFGFGGVVYNSWEGPSAYSTFVRVG